MDELDQEDILTRVAIEKGIVASADVTMIPEVYGPVHQGRRLIFQALLDISERSGAWNGGLNHHACCYLFAKAVEAVVAYGQAKGKPFSVYYDPKHLPEMDVHPEVNGSLKTLINDSKDLGEPLFYAHQEWVKKQMEADPDEFVLDVAIMELFKIVSNLGMSHAIGKRYHL